MARNLLIYRAEHLRKINSMRRAISQPDIYTVPVPNKGQVLFVSAAEMHNEPASCYNCAFYNRDKSCQLIGPHVIIRKFIYPPAPTSDSKQIEYWPCCSMQQYGDPHEGEKFIACNPPDQLGLIWINAPKPGQEQGGANCGGSNGGDDCDSYMIEGDDKRDTPSGFCRVLQCEVQNGDVCTQWMDDDRMTWEQAQNILREQSEKES